jgi:hypothetical protein
VEKKRPPPPAAVTNAPANCRRAQRTTQRTSPLRTCGGCSTLSPAPRRSARRNPMLPRPRSTSPPIPGRPVARSPYTRPRSWGSSTTSSRSRTSRRHCIVSAAILMLSFFFFFSPPPPPPPPSFLRARDSEMSRIESHLGLFSSSGI